MEDSNEDKRQECQYPQESMRMKMQANLEQRNIFYTMKVKNNATILWIPMKYANAKLLQSSDVKSYSIMLGCVCDHEKWGESPPFKEEWIVRDKRQKIWSMVKHERGSNPCAQVSSHEKEESTNFWEWRMSGGELKLI